MHEKIDKAYSVLGIIKGNFINMNSHSFILLYKYTVRPHVGLEYANGVWCPFRKGDIEALEKVQKRATKLVISVKHLPYEERRKRLNLPTLKYRRLRGDMIKVFKLLNNFYDKEVDFVLPLKPAFITRGNSYKLHNYSFHYDLRKYSFCPRVTILDSRVPSTRTENCTLPNPNNHALPKALEGSNSDEYAFSWGLHLCKLWTSASRRVNCRLQKCRVQTAERLGFSH